MSRYVTFMLDLVAGDDGLVESSVRGAPDPELLPTNVFAWKVTCDDLGHVVVRGVSGKQVVVIGTATREHGELRGCTQRGEQPNDAQWAKVGRAITRARELRGDDGAPAREEQASEPEAKPLAPAGRAAQKELARAVREERQRKRRSDQRHPRGDRWVLIGGAVVVGALLCGYVATQIFAGGAKTASTKPAAEPAGAVSTAPPSVEPAVTDEAPSDHGDPPPPLEPAVAADAPLEVRVAAAPDLMSAFALARPSITATGDAGLALLAAYRVRWSDVEVTGETSVARIEKDPARELGKRLCVDGVIERITRRDLPGASMFAGALRTGDGDRVAFVAAGSTGELVKRDRARFCGIVTGTAGGDAALFGMFDLPDNRKPPVEQPD